LFGGLKMFDLSEYNPVTYQEAERKAYFSGDAEKASLYARIMELEEQLETQQEEQNQQTIELEDQIEEQQKQIEELENSISDFKDILKQIKDII
jgi:TolA-binding protein